MKAFIAVALIGTLVVVCQTMTTTTHRPHTHHTKEPNEHEGFYFSYRNHQMIIKQGTSCYVAALTEDEQSDVHTDLGLKMLEVKLLGQMSSATPTTRDALTNQTLHMCTKHSSVFFTIP